MSKVFYTKFSELSGNRFDVSYYIPELVELEKKVTKISTNKLKDFVVSVSSGATPKKSANNDYYEEDKNKGIPFLRVQNLTTFGKLDFKGLKYITPQTHNEMLKRSQVSEDDLLIKITGVGRMAIASVPDKGFIGNTNQHMVVVKTKSREVSETLATYLNLDIAEKLASRRATGGTRPALDYPALLSIPVIYDKKIVQKMNDAYKQKEAKEKEAKEKLKSIDDYLLEALGIKFPKKRDESVEDRVFFRKFSEISENRIDPLFYNHEFYIYEKLLKEKPFRKFKYFINSINNGFDFRDYQTSGTPYLKVANIKKGSFDFSKIQYINFDSSEINKNIKLKKGNLLLTRKGTFGNALALDNDYNYVISSEIFYIELKKELINTDFLEIYFNSYVGQLQFDNNKIGAIMGSLSQGAIRELIIPTPSPNLQETIVTHITNLKNEAKALQEEASQIYNEAKTEVGKMILGEKV